MRFVPLTLRPFFDCICTLQAGQSQLMAARKQTPNFPERYALFMRQQQHMQRAHTSTTGESAVDLVSYVEFQRNYR